MQMVESGERAMADEYRSLFGLPESALTPADPAAIAAEEAERAARFLLPEHPKERRLLIERPEQLAEAQVRVRPCTCTGVL